MKERLHDKENQTPDGTQWLADDALIDRRIASGNFGQNGHPICRSCGEEKLLIIRSSGFCVSCETKQGNK